MTARAPQIWGPREGSPEARAVIDRLRAEVTGVAGSSADGYTAERLADLLVELEASSAALSDLAASPLERASATLDLLTPLTRWRVQRDLARVEGELRSLVGAESGDVATGWAEPQEALAAGARLVAGLDGVLEEALAAVAGAEGHDYLGGVFDDVTAAVPVLRACVLEDFDEEGDFVDAGLAWVLDPLSAAHTAAMMTPAALRAEADGDRWAGTVLRRWSYARVRVETVEGLSDNHLRKTRLLLRDDVVEVPGGGR